MPRGLAPQEAAGTLLAMPVAPAVARPTMVGLAMPISQPLACPHPLGWVEGRMVGPESWVGAEGIVVQVNVRCWHCQHWHCQMLVPLVVEPVEEVELAAEIQQIADVYAPAGQLLQRVDL